MAEDKAALREVHWRHLFPWFALFRAFGIAIDLRKMFLAALGVICMTSGWWLFANLSFWASDDRAVRQQAEQIAQWPWESGQWKPFTVAGNSDAMRLLDESGVILTQADRIKLQSRAGMKRGFDILDELVRSPLRTLWQLGTHWRFVLRPMEDLVHPFQTIFGKGVGFVSTAFTLLCGLWAVLVWALFGGAITRMAAVQFAREEKIGLVESLRFSSSKLLSYAGAPVIPLAFIVFFTILCVFGGWISCIPGIGPIFAGVLWLLPLLAGFAMTIILVLWAVGWPLMFSTISVEGSDSFDALSRSYAYTFQRPWHYLFYALVATVFGSLCSFFVLLFADVLVHASRWAVSWAAGDGLSLMLSQLTAYAPEASGWRVVGIEEPTGATRIGAIAAAVWFYMLFLLLVGFVYSYFWSSSTIIYYLLRRDVDNTEIQEVYLEGEADDFDAQAESPAPSSPVVSTTPAQGSDATGSQAPS